jgi:eukaryotic-like serine/threonine-protein kinase
MVDQSDGQQLIPGRRLAGNYEILASIGEGGTGEVYRAASLAEPGLEVAIKTLNRLFSDDPQMLRVVQQEAGVLRQVRSDAVVRYHTMLKDESDPRNVIHFLVMELVNGPSLSDYMGFHQLGMDEIWAIAGRVCDGLEEVHGLQVLHRDISPSNIILRDGAPERATLIDFGLARNYVLADHPDWLAGSGTIQYSSPEQLQGQDLSRAADFYSLGMTMLAVYNGQHIDTRNPPTNLLPPEFRHVVEALTQERPEDRPQRVSDVRQLFDVAMGTTRASAGADPYAGQAGVASMSGIDNIHKDDEPNKMPSRGQNKLSGNGDTKSNGRFIAAAIAAAFFAVSVAVLFLVPSVHNVVLGPSLQTVMPYVTTIEARSGGKSVTISGYVPSDDDGQKLFDAVRKELPGQNVGGNVEPALGAPNEAWVEVMPAVVGAAKSLSDWRVHLTDNTITLKGEAISKNQLDATRTEFAAVAGRYGYRAQFNIALAVKPLPQSALLASVADISSCGPLRFAGADLLGPEDRILVRGMVPSSTVRQQIIRNLKRIANEREIAMQVQEVNPELCKGVQLLPPIAQKFFVKERVGPISLVLGFDGNTGKTSDGVYYEGQVPVIHARIGSEFAKGYLYAFFVDEHDQLINFLPHTSRKNYALAGAGNVVGGLHDVQLTYEWLSNTNSTRAIKVGGPFGNAILVALATDRPIFSEIPIFGDNISQFAPDLKQALDKAKAGKFAYVLQPIITKPQ